MKTMKNLLLIVLTVVSISCKRKQSNKYVATYKKDGKTVTDTIVINEALQNQLNEMLTNPNYKPKLPANDTIFNSKGNPVKVILSDDIFGATVQKFEYDSTDKLIKITGYDNENNIRPFYHYIAIEINKYDQNGNLIEIKSLGENEQLISSEFEDTPIIRMKYNNNNQLIEEWFLDENESLRSEFAILKYKYDNQGNPISKEWYNEKGEKK